MDEHHFERAARLADMERDAMVHASQAQISAEPGNGICVDCEEPISAARLNAVPAARRCPDCQREREQR